jgi:TRAP-type C4-dicarboxylate transport system permease small subunit
MNATKLAGIVLLIIGVLGVGYGGFSFTKDTHRADIGPIHLSVAEKERVNIPMWFGVGALLVGGVLLVMRSKA